MDPEMLVPFVMLVTNRAPKDSIVPCPHLHN